jgi:anti-sigma B factor antagonist
MRTPPGRAARVRPVREEARMQAVSVSTETDGSLGIALRGELDFTNSAPVVEVIRTAVAEGRPTQVRVAMAEVTFLDSSGIGVLVNAMKAAEEVGAGYRVEHPSPRVLDQLRIAGLLEVFGLDSA